MDKKTFLCVFYTVLLILPATLLGMVPVKKKEEKRQAALLPLAAYAGSTLALPVFLALVAAYGIYAVIRNHIRSSDDAGSGHDSHSCYQNRGWCRPSCFRGESSEGEREIRWERGSYGSYICCSYS